RADATEDFAMGAADGLPVARDVKHVDAGAHDVLQPGAGALQRRLEVLERAHSLRAHVADADDLAVGPGRGGARDVDHVAGAHGARVADDWLPPRAARNMLPRHHCAFTPDSATTLAHLSTSRRMNF